MSRQVEIGLDWCKALWIKGRTKQAQALVESAMDSNPDQRDEIHAAWTAFLLTV